MADPMFLENEERVKIKGSLFSLFIAIRQAEIWGKHYGHGYFDLHTSH
jgi:hypothetical protein